jgi:long-chain acyl-CoA synthetase
MIYTSGTTGRPKGVQRAPADAEFQASMARVIQAGFGISAHGDFTALMTGPMYHSAPNSYGLTAVRNGARVVLQPRFDAEDLLATIERERISHMHVVPTMFVRLLRLPEEVRRRYDVSSLEFVVHGAAPCPPAVKRAMIDWWGPVINEYYGSTETSLITVQTSEEALARPGSVGRPMPGATVRIYDDEGRVLPTGEVGEIYMRHSLVVDFTYRGRDDARAEVERDGLITCGDVGYLDEDGYLYLCDRKRDMVISGGVNIYPAEIEAALLQMPEVRDCAVFGIPHEEFGETLCAYVEPQAGASPSPEEIRIYLASHISDYKIPRLIELRPSLPREDTGKIFKRKLREPYWRDAGRHI